nr:helix-turn-helix domain-containing protein [Paraburkholderia hayleyella]
MGQILQALVAADAPLTLGELAATAGMSSAKAFPHLVSLLKTGLLQRDAQGRFNAGPLACELGLIGLQRLSPPREAEAEIVSLAAATGLSVALAVLGPLGPTVIRLEESVRPVHVSLRVGTVVSLVKTAIGRTFAAYLGETMLRDLLRQDACRLAGVAPEEIFLAAEPEASKGPGAATTSAAPARMAALRLRYVQHLARIRHAGMDHALNKPIPGIGTLSAPVFNHSGEICLVLALLGPANLIDPGLADPLTQTLRAAVQQLSWRLGYSPTAGKAGEGDKTKHKPGA